ncbi:hypothetical protein T265_03063 [Opisthorchis viverrini]|uniref:Uncharacterized protein n=1 Tax=Opisthorchis viverrini TaxID=6198 RepID=A0A075AHW4_OPIVI|nr:hypothetical protein T265_03063 [Opisthorchis viverrini]KER30589.1 hypothetical protein T265_03063 [Opisthorchis viverrini]
MQKEGRLKATRARFKQNRPMNLKLQVVFVQAERLRVVDLLHTLLQRPVPNLRRPRPGQTPLQKRSRFHRLLDHPKHHHCHCSQRIGHFHLVAARTEV